MIKILLIVSCLWFSVVEALAGAEEGDPSAAELAAASGVRGVTRCDADLNLALAVAGRIAAVKVEEGTLVKQGTLLLHLDRQAEEYDVERRRVQWMGQAELKAAQARRDTAEKQVMAARRIFNASHGISREELENRELAFSLAESEVVRLRTAKEMERLDYLTAKENLARRNLLAPTRGIVVKLVKQLGESVQANETVLRLCDLRRILFVAHLPLEQSEKFQVGDKVVLRVGERPIRVQGNVLFVSPVVESSSGLREIKIEMLQPDPVIRPGMPATLENRE
ncbi:MAG: efflux RND transporter periplasmic adaptor subunit [Magnetococcales bacterium]|nr:efflux RND transporter periplasmic adaptor subunit [Magnetococcales bacterium]